MVAPSLKSSSTRWGLAKRGTDCPKRRGGGLASMRARALVAAALSGARRVRDLRSVT